MKTLMMKLASTKLTVLVFALLGLALVTKEFLTLATSWAVVASIGMLTLNLVAALIMKPRLRRESGLLVFHLALLALLLLAGLGRLTHFDGHVEMLEGNVFSVSEVVTNSQGPFHPAWLQDIAFLQGPFSVDYAPGVKRARTRSEVLFQSKSGGEWHRVGDDVPFLADGFRFYTTHNKGIAAILTWLPSQGGAITGAVHMPGYPLFDWKQANRWQAPGGPDIRFWLHLDTPVQEDRAWTLTSDRASGVLVVNTLGNRAELRRGETVSLEGGTLRFDELRGWMGYRIFFDPTLPWMLSAAVVAVFGLALQFWRKSKQFKGDVFGTSPAARVA
ncbi:MAG: cytochrome c biogenesis protein ResB [Betaproteobacteria bacterium]|nr:cytochrome c biogenesis protein ResB [Betaproteobacteria bacterium]